jgi:hypothetical protein
MASGLSQWEIPDATVVLEPLPPALAAAAVPGWFEVGQAATIHEGLPQAARAAGRCTEREWVHGLGWDYGDPGPTTREGVEGALVRVRPAKLRVARGWLNMVDLRCPLGDPGSPPEELPASEAAVGVAVGPVKLAACRSVACHLQLRLMPRG